MRLLVTGGTGVLGRALSPLAAAAGHQLVLPTHDELDLFDLAAVDDAMRQADGVVHLASRIRWPEHRDNPEAWRENDRLRAEASRILVDAAIAAGAAVYVQPTVTFVYPPEGPGVRDDAHRGRRADPALGARGRTADRPLHLRRRARRGASTRHVGRPGHRQRRA